MDKLEILKEKITSYIPIVEGYAEAIIKRGRKEFKKGRGDDTKHFKIEYSNLHSFIMKQFEIEYVNLHSVIWTLQECLKIIEGEE